MARRALIIGAGFTGARAARMLLGDGWRVTATTRTPSRLEGLRALGAKVRAFDAAGSGRLDVRADGATVLLSVPTLRNEGALDEPTPRILAGLRGQPEHVTYLSTTGVYGATKLVDETTAPAPETERQRLRRRAEKAVLALPCPALVLRPAAIYGPYRGVHAAMRAGRFRLARGGRRFVSRIHVEDLAGIAAAAMTQKLVGVFPVADDLAATSRDVALFCSDLLGVAPPPEVPNRKLGETRLSDRRVDGRAVRRRLGVRLRHPTYREGIRASIAAEQEA